MFEHKGLRCDTHGLLGIANVFRWYVQFNVYFTHFLTYM